MEHGNIFTHMTPANPALEPGSLYNTTSDHSLDTAETERNRFFRTVLVVVPIALVFFLFSIWCWNKCRLYRQYDRRQLQPNSTDNSTATDTGAPPGYNALYMTSFPLSPASQSPRSAELNNNSTGNDITSQLPPSYEDVIKVTVEENRVEGGAPL